jgi:hypothetical protein
MPLTRQLRSRLASRRSRCRRGRRDRASVVLPRGCVARWPHVDFVPVAAKVGGRPAHWLPAATGATGGSTGATGGSTGATGGSTGATGGSTRRDSTARRPSVTGTPSPRWRNQVGAVRASGGRSPIRTGRFGCRPARVAVIVRPQSWDSPPPPLAPRSEPPPDAGGTSPTGARPLRPLVTRTGNSSTSLPGVFAPTWRARLVVAIHAWVRGRRPASSATAARSEKRGLTFVDRRVDIDGPA